MHLFFGSWRTGFVQWLLGADLGRSSASAGLLLTPETPVHNIIYCYVEIYYIWNTFSLETAWAQTVALQLTQGSVSGELNTRHVEKSTTFLSRELVNSFHKIRGLDKPVHVPWLFGGTHWNSFPNQLWRMSWASLFLNKMSTGWEEPLSVFRSHSREGWRALVAKTA